MRVNHEYRRGGALAYLAAYDAHHARVLGRCEPTTGIVPFMNLVTQVMTSEPYTSAKRVFWIVDNGSSHRGKAAIDRLGLVRAIKVLAAETWRNCGRSLQLEDMAGTRRRVPGGFIEQ
ncbi:hypothetical protein ACFYWN_44505 [Streptomyces sp. NPDC002917]|uniref:hypothetical protein n=1 Tax=Streptomyces sp. NPDC002917 TaxID=3364671 RepID=UPI0036BC81DF